MLLIEINRPFLWRVRNDYLDGSNHLLVAIKECNVRPAGRQVELFPDFCCMPEQVSGHRRIAAAACPCEFKRAILRETLFQMGDQ